MPDLPGDVQEAALMLTRRGALLGSSIILISGNAICCTSAAGHEYHTFGCCVPPNDTKRYLDRSSSVLAATDITPAFNEDKVRKVSPSPAFDYALAQGLGDLCAQFEVKPGFCYYEEDNKDYNALATDKVIADLKSGTVLLGFNMVSYLFQNFRERPAAAVLAVMAHEFGHIVALTRGLNSQLAPNRKDPYRAEQFADFMSGYYSGQRKLEDSSFPAVMFASTLERLGGDVRGSHGTHEERGSAALEGFKTGNKKNITLNEAVEAGFRFAMDR